MGKMKCDEWDTHGVRLALPERVMKGPSYRSKGSRLPTMTAKQSVGDIYRKTRV